MPDLNQNQFGRAGSLYGKNNVDALFKGNPVTAAPWPRAGRRKDVHDYDKNALGAGLKNPKYESVDPRTLHATQPMITRQGVSHYMAPNRNEAFADGHQAGNKDPVVYKRDDGTNMLLSGHHRAAKALLKGEPLTANVVHGPWGPKR